MIVTLRTYRWVFVALLHCAVSGYLSAQQTTAHRLISVPFEGTEITDPHDIALDANGYLWIVDDAHLYCLLSDGPVIIAQVPAHNSERIQFNGIGAGVVTMSTEQGEISIPIDAIGLDKDRSVTSVAITPATEKQFLFAAGHEDSSSSTDHFRATRQLTDPANGTWLLLPDRLVLLCNDGAFLKVRNLPIGTGRVNQVWDDAESGRKILLTSRHGIAVIDEQSGSKIAEVTESTTGRPVSGFAWATIAGEHFAMSNSGLFQIDLSDLTAELILEPTDIKVNGQSSASFNTLDSDSRTDLLLIGTKDDLVLLFDPSTRTTEQISISGDQARTAHDLIYQVDLIDKNTLLVLASSGFYFIDLVSLEVHSTRQAWTNLKFGSAFSPSGVQVIGDSALFISSFNKGFYYYSITRNELTRPQGPLFDDIIATDVFWDRSEHVFATTNGGLVIFHIPSRTVRLLGVDHGLPEQDLYYKHMKVQKPGTIHLGFTDKIVTINSDELERRKEVLPFIEKVEVNGMDRSIIPRPLGTLIELGHLERSCALHLGSPDRTFPRTTGSFVKLDGQSSNAAYYAPHEVIRFHALPLGKNEILIGNSSSSELKPLVTLAVAAPFWRTWLFIALLIASLIAIATLLIRGRIQNIKQRAKMKAEYDARITQLELSSLRAQMHPHFIFNSLNSIKSFIASNEPRTATRYLNKFAHLIRSILNNSRHSRIDLRSELRALQLYLELEQMRFDKRFDLSIDVAEDIDLDETKIPPLIIQPYVENAIWHGLMHKDGDRKLDIELLKDDHVLVATIRDNGIGRQAAEAIKSKSATKNKSLGMNITSEILERTNGGGSAGIQINDLVDASGHVQGTEVVIRIPLTEQL